jgi:Cu/Zn superoxide dismutase
MNGVVGCGDETKDILGKELIVHANPDDFNIRLKTTNTRILI